MKNSKGFTLVELLIVVVMVAIVFVALPTVFMGNFWYTEEGVLRELKNGGMVTGNAIIIRTERNIWKSSQIEISDSFGNSYGSYNCVAIFDLDTNILFNYKLTLNRSYKTIPNNSHETDR
ncbi:MAG TPA: prepilin-type N-terminal cleavage/methylation domain-containing protein [Candidatus Paceibacterota bacterium]|nr:prepilin-type N-terminal cleavage/methylation domain-containing protein [Candidatus Paceibacterota bacterium]